MSNSTDIQKSLFDTMKIFSDAATKNSGANITFTGIIDGTKTSNNGTYWVKYNNNEYQCSSQGLKYSDKESVYVLAPYGKFDSGLIILGAVTPTAKTYINDFEDSQTYYSISGNLFIKGRSLTLNSFSSAITKDNNSDGNIYSDSTFIKNNATFNTLVSNYLDTYETFKFSFQVKTSFKATQKGSGNYGMCLHLPLIRLSDSNAVWQKMFLDVSNFTGNPYNFLLFADQETYFTLDKTKFNYDTSRVPYLSYYCYGFPSGTSTTKDITIKNISLEIVRQISEDDLKGYTLILQSYNKNGEISGTKFNDGTVYAKDKKILTPILKISGNNASLKGSEIYWFIEDMSIKSGDEDYVSYGGVGWKCLNKKKSISENDDGTITYNYDTSYDNYKTYTINETDVDTETRFKCVIVYDDTHTPSATITLNNLSSTQEIFLIAADNINFLDSNGNSVSSLDNASSVVVDKSLPNTFAKNTEYVNLYAFVYDEDKTKVTDYQNSIVLNWVRYDKNNNVIDDDDDYFIENQEYHNKIIKIGTKSYYVSNTKFPISDVSELNTVYCTAKYILTKEETSTLTDEDGTQTSETTNVLYEDPMGTARAEISIVDRKEAGVMITGDNVIYKYSTDGNKPDVTFSPLSFKITNADGSEIEDNLYKTVSYKWTVPANKKASMFTVDSSLLLTQTTGATDSPTEGAIKKEVTKTTESDIDYYTVAVYVAETDQNGNISFVKNYTYKYWTDGDYYYFSGKGNNFNLIYGIQSRYCENALKNPIQLKITYQKNVTEVSAAINFIKDGKNGTNGTDYSVILTSGGSSAEDLASVAYGTLDSDGVARKLKFLYNIKDNKIYRYDYDKETVVQLTDNVSDKKIFAQVYRENVLLDASCYSVVYSMFDKNTLNPCFTVSDGVLTFDNSKAEITINSTPCNIVQAEVTISDGQSASASKQIIYAYYPIELTILNADLTVVDEDDSSQLNLPIIPSLDGGFSEVMYASDGTNPSYDSSTNFSVNDDEIIRLSSKKGGNGIKKVADYAKITWSVSSHLGIYKTNTKKAKETSSVSVGAGEDTEIIIKPDNKYDDGSSKNYVKTILTLEGTEAVDSIKEEKSKIDLQIKNEKNNYKYAVNVIKKYNNYMYNVSSPAATNWYVILNAAEKEGYSFYNLLKYENRADKALDNISNEIAILEENPTYLKKIEGTDFQTALKTLSSKVKIAKKKLYQSTSTSSLVSLEGKTLSALEGGGVTVRAINLEKDNINNFIAAYEKNRKEIVENSNLYNEFMTISKAIGENVRTIANIIPDAADLSDGAVVFERYSKLKKNLLSIADNFSKGSSVNYLKKTVRSIYTLLRESGIAKFDSDYKTYKLLTIKNSLIKEYNTNLNNYNTEKDALKAELRSAKRLAAFQNAGSSIVHIRPIVFYFNRYGMSNINGWDGNKTEVADGYILSPQVGAGVKNADNSFTGVVMGIKNIDETHSRKGLYGYAEGVQSFVLDAENGSAIFGKAGGGQIIIDPAQSAGALLFSSNYWSNYKSDYSGLPASYSDSNKAGAGMCINLSKGEILFGNGNFSVDSDGKLSAKSAEIDGKITATEGTVGGWTVGSSSLLNENDVSGENSDGKYIVRKYKTILANYNNYIGQSADTSDDGEGKTESNIGNSRVFHCSITNGSGSEKNKTWNSSSFDTVAIQRDGTVRCKDISLFTWDLENGNDSFNGSNYNLISRGDSPSTYKVGSSGYTMAFASPVSRGANHGSITLKESDGAKTLINSNASSGTIVFIEGSDVCSDCKYCIYIVVGSTGARSINCIEGTIEKLVLSMDNDTGGIVATTSSENDITFRYNILN